MGEKIYLTPEQIRSTSEEIKRLADEYQLKYKDFYTEVRRLDGTVFSGKDQEAFMAKVTSFEKSFEAMYDLMLDYSNYLSNTAQAFETTQSTLINKAGNLVG